MSEVIGHDTAMRRTRRRSTRQCKASMRRVVTFALLLVLTACSSGNHQAVHFNGKRVGPTSPTAPVTPRLPAQAVKVVAAGDIACPPQDPITTVSCQQAATARLAFRLDPSWVLTLGDEQYETGSRSEFEGSYDASWGALKSRTKPLPGNHEYKTKHADGYDGYFGPRHHYYATRLGSWRAYLLNSNCDQIDCARERSWLRHQLSAHPTRCSLIAMHHPRYSSGSVHGSEPAMASFWQIAINHHVDLALAGHEHDYERFVRMDAHGHRSPTGMVSFVVGTGGKSLYALRARLPGSAYFENTEFGVLLLWLGADGFTWQFRTIGPDPTGVVRDTGSGSCR
jgi:acid phosphatase type 7